MRPTFARILYLLIFYLQFSNFLTAQVGINTTMPIETIDINGTAAIRDLSTHATSTSKLLGSDNQGVVGGVEIGRNLELTNGVLNASIEGTRYLPVIITDNFFTNTFNDLDFDINGGNSDKTLFILRGIGSNAATTTFTGLQGGTDGRVIIIRADRQNFNMFIVNESPNSLPQNRFQFNTNPGQSENVNGYGSFTFVYVSDVQRWVLINKEIL